MRSVRGSAHGLAAVAAAVFLAAAIGGAAADVALFSAACPETGATVTESPDFSVKFCRMTELQCAELCAGRHFAYYVSDETSCSCSNDSSSSPTESQQSTSSVSESSGCEEVYVKKKLFVQSIYRTAVGPLICDVEGVGLCRGNLIHGASGHLHSDMVKENVQMLNDLSPFVAQTETKFYAPSSPIVIKFNHSVLVRYLDVWRKDEVNYVDSVNIMYVYEHPTVEHYVNISRFPYRSQADGSSSPEQLQVPYDGLYARLPLRKFVAQEVIITVTSYIGSQELKMELIGCRYDEASEGGRVAYAERGCYLFNASQVMHDPPVTGGSPEEVYEEGQHLYTAAIMIHEEHYIGPKIKSLPLGRPSNESLCQSENMNTCLSQEELILSTGKEIECAPDAVRQKMASNYTAVRENNGTFSNSSLCEDAALQAFKAMRRYIEMKHHSNCPNMTRELYRQLVAYHNESYQLCVLAVCSEATSSSESTTTSTAATKTTSSTITDTTSSTTTGKSRSNSAVGSFTTSAATNNPSESTTETTSAPTSESSSPVCVVPALSSPPREETSRCEEGPPTSVYGLKLRRPLLDEPLCSPDSNLALIQELFPPTAGLLFDRLPARGPGRAVGQETFVGCLCPLITTLNASNAEPLVCTPDFTYYSASFHGCVVRNCSSSEPSEAPEGGTRHWNESVIVDSKMNYTCPADHFFEVAAYPATIWSRCVCWERRWEYDTDRPLPLCIKMCRAIAASDVPHLDEKDTAPPATSYGSPPATHLLPDTVVNFVCTAEPSISVSAVCLPDGTWDTDLGNETLCEVTTTEATTTRSDSTTTSVPTTTATTAAETKASTTTDSTTTAAETTTSEPETTPKEEATTSVIETTTTEKETTTTKAETTRTEAVVSSPSQSITSTVETTTTMQTTTNTSETTTQLHYTMSSDTPPAASTTEATVIDTPSPPYSETAYSYYSVLQNNMTDTDEINATYVATDAPFGFGYAVKIDRVQKQCLKQTDFPEKARPKCMSNPIKCNDTGLSFSIWEKHTYTQDEFIRSGNNQLKESDKKYVLSTGGDTMGHPGIAFYHYGIFQYVVVSTGDEYWEVRVPGLMENATWANIGFSWLPTVTENPDGTKSGGLELYINKKLEGRSFYPKATGGAKPGLNPDELMLGCHKTNESSVYRYFGDGEYDELAYWKRALADNETDYFLGGYLEDFSHLTTEEMSEKLANIDMKNPDTLGDALVVVEQMSRQHERPTSAPETTASDIASLASSSPTPAGPNSLQALKEAEDLKRREDLLDILQRMYAEENSADVLTYSQADKLLSGLSAVSNLMSADSASDWKKIQANGSAGSADLMWSSVNFARRTFCSIKYDNNTKPFTVVKGFENLIFYGQKMLYEDLKARGKYVQIPDYGNEKLKPYKTKWNQVFDMGRVMTNVLNDNHCDKRPVCLMTIVFNTYDDIGPTPVNIANIPGDREHEMGARLLYGSLTSDKARDANGKVNYSAPLCQLDKFTMSRNPFYTKLENKVRVPALRQLRFHSDEVVTKVSTRRCAFWNEKLSDFGAWDTDGCQVVDSNEMYTKCTCEKFGSMMVLDEKVQDPAVPPDPSWLNIVKFVLYCISAVVLVFYCIVVAVSSDLKEQFHLMGMYLSISVLIGSISMLVSDLDAIRDSRHLCTTLSTITHYFYVAAGLWVACLGHASFKAITSGEVGGKLNSYSCISWGVAMFSVGVPYAFFVRDLGTDPRCFVTWENNGKAAFFLPQVACVCIAFFFGVVVLFNLSTPALRKENLVEDYGSFCRGAAFVMLYFAITWTFGLLAYMRFGISVDFYPLFQVFNSAMGIIIVIFIGIASYRFRTVLVGKAKSRHEKIKSLAGIKKSKLEEEQPSPKRPRSTKEKSPERPATQSSLHPPQQRGQVAGRPGSRPVTPNE